MSQNRAALGRVRKVPSGPRRLARTLAAPAEIPSTSSTRDVGRHAESTHQTPQATPFGRTTGLSGHDPAAASPPVRSTTTTTATASPLIPQQATHVILSVRDDLQRYGLERMLGAVDAAGTCRSFAELSAAVDAVHDPRTDLLLIVPEPADLDGDSVLHRVAAYGVRVLLLLPDTRSVDLDRVASVAGASLLFSDGLDAAALGDMLGAMRAGEVRIPAALTRPLLELAGRGAREVPAAPRLTPREREALTLVVDGLSNKQIGRRLRISEHGAKRLVANILAKLNCPNRTLAAARALREGLCGHPAAAPRGPLAPPAATHAPASPYETGW
ncbi:DNA-binding NarL/FixJ family response regulator [Streptomyces sp. KhCrAH-43]|uniref:response regulator transcription factor n=1 Tax=unclassified Streptomyces TaxID=2593676 RepID=UPI0003704E4B|nr:MULTISPECIES: response regulator transcription factor [unclassified Streptomyces]MYS36477.1 DNA-binding response regulator [Streptomyces sp. SID4920]MYX69976.1 DNA-binding response regulator [Streptomyces sp. SID8373]RAJ52335.1 DNA-binding NarL/FixJ family response regulator [Streptomyces sp. KhCrAH-43]